MLGKTTRFRLKDTFLSEKYIGVKESMTSTLLADYTTMLIEIIGKP